jgi:DNA mismatch repair protein MutL
MKQFTLAYPHIAFKIVLDGREVLSYPAQDVGVRASEIFGPEVFKALIKVDASLGGAALKGFISRPDTVRKARGNQYLFINGRPVQNKALNHAVFQAYGNSIMAGEYPYYVLFLEYDPGLIDVNVHPTKMEVRFANEQSIYHFFMHAVQMALNKESVIPTFGSGSTEGSIIRSTISEMDKPREIMQELVSRKKDMARFSGSQLSLTYFQSGPEVNNQETLRSVSPAMEKPVQKSTAEIRFWQLHQRYIVTEIRSGLVFIDQHVAHERILYEKISRILADGDRSYSQKLLFPHKMTLSPDDFVVFNEISETLTRFGFSISVFSGTTIVIEAMPVDVKIGRESQILLDIIDYYRNRPLQGFNHLEKVSAAYACKNAVKSGEVLTIEEMQSLVDQLFACESPFFCPHGRPVIVTIELEELDKKFKRIPS